MEGKDKTQTQTQIISPAIVKQKLFCWSFKKVLAKAWQKETGFKNYVS